MGWLIDRWMPQDATAARRQVDLLRLGVLIQLAAETTVWAISGNLQPAWGRVALAVGYTVCLALGLRPSWRRRALGLAVALLAVHIAWAFPFVANHRYLIALLAAAAVTVDTRHDEEPRLLVAFVRGMTVVLLFHTGMQKLLHGTYFEAAYLGWMVGHSERFAALFAPLIGDVELLRLRGLGDAVGSGPYGTRSPLLLIAGNVVWAGEIALAGLVAWPRTRSAGLVGALLLFTCIQLGARELFFGGLSILLLAACADDTWLRRALWLVAPGYLLLVLIRAWLAPGWWFN